MSAVTWIDTGIDIPDDRLSLKLKPKWYHYGWIVLVSLALHAVMLWLFSLQGSAASSPNKHRAIQATILFETPKIQRQDDHVPVEPTVKEQIVPEEPDELAHPPAEISKERSSEIAVMEVETPFLEPAANDTQDISLTTPESSPEQGLSSSSAKGGITGRTSDFLRQQQQQAQRSLVDSATSNRALTMYQQRRPSNEVYQPKSFEEQNTKEVNCDNTATKGVAMLSGLFGGTIKCTAKPDVDKFIDKRVKRPPK